MMNSIDPILWISRSVHILAAMAAIGGAMFALVALLPSMHKTLDEEPRRSLKEAIHSRWAKVVHASIGLLFITGIVNFMLVAMPPKVDPMPYHGIFGLKFLVAMGVFFIASALAGKSPGLAKMRQAGHRWLTILLLLGVTIVFLSGLLVQVRHASDINRAQVVAPQTTPSE